MPHFTVFHHPPADLLTPAELDRVAAQADLIILLDTRGEGRAGRTGQALKRAGIAFRYVRVDLDEWPDQMGRRAGEPALRTAVAQVAGYRPKEDTLDHYHDPDPADLYPRP